MRFDSPAACRTARFNGFRFSDSSGCVLVSDLLYAGRIDSPLLRPPIVS